MSDRVELPCGFPSGCLLAATCCCGYVRSGCHIEVAGGAGSCSLQLWSTIKQAFTGFRGLLTARLRLSPVVVPQPLFFSSPVLFSGQKLVPSCTHFCPRAPLSLLGSCIVEIPSLNSCKLTSISSPQNHFRPDRDCGTN